MSYRNFMKEEFYHLYHHGIDDKIIFLETADYQQFLVYLEEFNDENNIRLYERKLAIQNGWKIKKGAPLVNITAYTLMPDHIHLYFQAKGNAEASLFIQKIIGVYTKYFNKKYGRRGALFCGKTKTKHIDNQAYFLHITYYIHLNILDLINKRWREGKMKLSEKEQDFLFSYPWSSIGFYINRTPNKIIHQKLIEEFCLNPKEYKEELINWSARFVELDSLA